MNMENKKKRSPIMVIGFAVLIGFLVIALLMARSVQAALWPPRSVLPPAPCRTLMEVRSDVFKAIAKVSFPSLNPTHPIL